MGHVFNLYQGNRGVMKDVVRAELNPTSFGANGKTKALC